MVVVNEELSALMICRSFSSESRTEYSRKNASLIQILLASVFNKDKCLTKTSA